MPGCSQVIAIVTDGYQERVLDPTAASPVCQEFALVPYLYRADSGQDLTLGQTQLKLKS